ncbi:alpha/beta fold hydrolase [Actinokineospora enzanensis]|uniref:alpha/beta fold hydrolase n=1 Tax=Actinokineospora enzanensis TaxID=155975 RepID=UPI0004781798|nr:alpha/beta hydrolase [Actinokineospora enzanensis]
MSTFVLLHGAGDDARGWRYVLPLLSGLGHEVIAPNMPVADDSAGIAEYADAVIDAIGERRDLVLVAQSMAGFVAPIVADALPVNLIVLVNAMVPLAGESAGDWWAATGQADARRASALADGRDPDAPLDVVDTFLHDVPKDRLAELLAEPQPPGQSDGPFDKPWPLDRWPDTPTRAIVGLHDRFFPPEFQRRVLHDRLGIVPEEINAGHVPALSRPEELTHLLVTYLG